MHVLTQRERDGGEWWVDSLVARKLRREAVVDGGGQNCRGLGFFVCFFCNQLGFLMWENGV